VLDAVVLSGGPDIDPQMYGAMPQSNTVGVDRRRDEAELAIAVAAMKHDLPVLGICRGAQMMNIACGGTLYQHLPDVVGHSGHKGSAPGEFAAHEVIVCPDSRLDKIIGPSRSVLSRHHQGLAQLGAGLRAAAVAHDGSVEAIEHVSRRSLYLGVLWHAELDHGSGVFEALIEDAHRARTERSCKAAAEPNSEVWLTGGDRYASM
jgi:gamma-glutamyl-gamma-aminobutyrate hydrolase PuuD